jgi:SAM-dependent MidA family methyltransferase
LNHGACVAIDYGHTRAQRPPLGSLASFRAGRSVPVGYLGDRDVTADVAVDALTAAVGGSLRRQSEWLADLGLDARRPPVSLATSQPAAYVRALSRAGEAAELTAPGGLGDFWWLLTTAGVADPFGMGA